MALITISIPKTQIYLYLNELFLSVKILILVV